jgi:hypothetical protein
MRESAAAIFSIIASCRLHSIDPQQYLDEFYASCRTGRAIATSNSRRTTAAIRAKLDPDELNAALSSFTIPAA